MHVANCAILHRVIESTYTENCVVLGLFRRNKFLKGPRVVTPRVGALVAMCILVLML